MSTLQVATKVCTQCKVERPLSEFYKSSKAPDGHMWSCSHCERQKSIVRQAKRRAKMGEAAFLREARLSVALGRQRGTIDYRPTKARNLARDELARRHPKEFEALVRLIRAELGLSPEPRKQRKQTS